MADTSTQNTSKLPEAIRQLQDSDLYRGLGASNFSIPGEQHSTLIAYVDEVRTRMGIPHVDTVVVQGPATCLGYVGSLDVLLLPTPIMESLTPEEAKAFIAHELDHKEYLRTHTDHDQAQAKALAAVQASDWAGYQAAQNELQAISEIMETSADRRAAEMYGAGNMRSALVKALLDSPDGMLQSMLGIMDPDTYDAVPHATYERHLHAIANGEVSSPAKELDTRFAQLRALEAAQGVPLGKYTHSPAGKLALIGGTVAAGSILLQTGDAKAALYTLGETSASSLLPGAGSAFAAIEGNTDEALVRGYVDAVTLEAGVLGTWGGAIAGGAGGSVVPGAGTAAGAAGGAAVGGVVLATTTSLAADEYYRLTARYLQGKRETVAPSAGEQLAVAIAETTRAAGASTYAYMEQVATDVAGWFSDTPQPTAPLLPKTDKETPHQR